MSEQTLKTITIQLYKLTIFLSLFFTCFFLPLAGEHFITLYIWIGYTGHYKQNEFDIIWRIKIHWVKCIFDYYILQRRLIHMYHMPIYLEHWCLPFINFFTTISPCSSFYYLYATDIPVF